MRHLVFIAAAAALAACSPPASKAPDSPSPAEPGPTVTSCNSLAPDLTKLVTVQDEAAAALPSAELRGGPLVSGTYDLERAVRIGEGKGWDGGRAAALEVLESGGAVLLNWASRAEHGPTDTWSANLSDAREQASVTFTCGRIGTVNAAYVAGENALDLRIEDGANGSLHMVFAKRP